MGKESAAIGILETHQQVVSTVKDLRCSGFDMKKLSIVGKGCGVEEQSIGFYTTGQRAKFCGRAAVLWGGLWGTLFGKGAGGVSALGAALYSLGLPGNSILKYEAALKANQYLIIANGDAAEVEKAYTTMRRLNATIAEVLVAA